MIGGSGLLEPVPAAALKQQDFEIIDLKISNQFPENVRLQMCEIPNGTGDNNW